MKQLMVFPFCNDVKVILENVRLVKEYKLVYIGILSETHLPLNNDVYSGAELGTDYSKGLEKADALWLCDPPPYIPLKAYYAIIQMAEHKEIIISNFLYEKLKDSQLNNCNIEIIQSKEVKIPFKKSLLYNLEIPVITIIGMGENCNKFEVQSNIFINFKNAGYKVSALTPNHMGKLLGMHIIPQCMYNSKMTFEEKVIFWNHYMYSLMLEETPDIFIVTVPGGVMPINRYANNYFGELAHVMCQAVTTDIGIMNLYFPENLSERQISNISDYCKYGLGISISSFAISKQQYSTDEEKECISFRHMENYEYDKHFPNMKCNEELWKLTDKLEQERIINKWIEELSQNVDVL